MHHSFQDRISSVEVFGYITFQNNIIDDHASCMSVCRFTQKRIKILLTAI